MMMTSLTEPQSSPVQHSLILLRGVVQRWAYTAAPLAERKGIRFSYGIDPALPQHIYINADMLTQIATELLLNAVKYTPHGEVALTLNRHGDTLEIEVRDTGVGIPSYLTSSALLGGTGPRVPQGGGGNVPIFGLTTVRKLVETLGGKVTIQSELGAGSTVTVLLPIVTSSDEPTRP